MSSSRGKIIEVEEQYHRFRRGEWICRYGIYGLTREYYHQQNPVPKAESRRIVLKLPEVKIRVLQAVITAHCNLKCAYCSFNANSPKLTTSEMTRAELEELSEIFNSQIGPEGLLLITGGEPELYTEAVDFLVNHIRGKIILFTNGTLIQKKRLQFYKERAVGVLFSLDGDLFAQESVRRSRDGSYHKIAEALKSARELDLDYGISAVVGDHNIERLPQLVEFIQREFQPASLGLNLPHLHVETAWMRIEEYTNALIEIFHFARREGLFIDQINRRLAPLISRRFRFRDCSAQGGKIVIFPGGIKTSCVNEAALGERRVPWADRIPIHSEQCRNCYAIGICGGGCIFDGEAIYGGGHFDERNCHYTKALLEHLVWDFWDELGEKANDQRFLNERYYALINRAKGTYFSVGHETG